MKSLLLLPLSAVLLSGCGRSPAPAAAPVKLSYADIHSPCSSIPPGWRISRCPRHTWPVPAIPPATTTTGPSS
ncbi:MAG: hypothetical protein U1F87_06600 [Kiritimatiellia bacterium]